MSEASEFRLEHLRKVTDQHARGVLDDYEYQAEMIRVVTRLVDAEVMARRDAELMREVNGPSWLNNTQ